MPVVLDTLLTIRYKREISEKIFRAAQVSPVVVLSGPRQTGKTSLLRELFPEFHYVSLDLPSEAELAEHRPQEFLQLHPCPVIVDLLEAKWTEIPDLRDTKAMQTLRNQFTQGTRQVHQSPVVCRTPQKFPLGIKMDAISGFNLSI